MDSGDTKGESKGHAGMEYAESQVDAPADGHLMCQMELRRTIYGYR